MDKMYSNRDDRNVNDDAICCVICPADCRAGHGVDCIAMRTAIRCVASLVMRCANCGTSCNMDCNVSGGSCA